MANLVSQFNTSIRSGIAPLTVNFTNVSTGPYNSVSWDFGDGTTSSQINPSHQFLNDGTYQVTLTIFDDQNETSQVNTSIVVFADVDYSTSSTTQQALFTTKRFSVGQVNVGVTEVVGTDIVKTKYGIIASSEGSNDNWLGSSAVADGNFNMLAPASGFSGTTKFLAKLNTNHDRQGTDDTFWPLKVLTNDHIGGFVTIIPELWSGVTPTNAVETKTVEELYSGGTLEGRSCLHYKLVSYDLTSDTFTVDRPLPNYSGLKGAEASGLCNFIIWAKSSGLTGEAHWDNITATTISNASTTMSVDQLQTLDTQGLTHFSGNSTNGTTNYFGEFGVDGKSFSVNSMISSDGSTIESYNPGSVLINYPFVLWHTSNTNGVSLYDSADSTMIDAETSLPYRYLRMGTTTADHAVGKIFHTAKYFTITDQEFLAATQFNSNRNWTCPEPFVSTNSTTAGVSASGVTYYVTYRLRDDGTIASGETSLGFGNAGLDPLHCRYVKTATTENDTSQFKIVSDASTWYTSTPTNMSGFPIGNVDVIIGTGVTANNYPDITSFMYSAMTTSYSGLQSGLVIPDYDDFVLSYDLADTTISGNTDFGFGAEYRGLFFMSANTVSNVYKMSTTCVAKNNEFNATQNETFDESLNESVYISEVALYNEKNELLMTGKLNSPIEKNDQKFITIKLELDL